MLIRFLIFFFLFISSILQGHFLSNYFNEEEEGAFLLLDLKEGKRLVEYNPQLCETKLTPCSTFKIPNALIGLDVGLLEDENTLFEWDGTPQPFAAWEQDHTLKSAIHYSAVWYFQNLAQKIGEDVYRKYLTLFNYGNRDISSGLTNFWLGSSLLISPNEQLQFLANFYLDKLPVSKHASEIVKKILILEKNPGWALSGKTGSDRKQHIGWFIGHVSLEDKGYVFVTCVRGGNATGIRAKLVTQRILQDFFNENCGNAN